VMSKRTVGEDEIPTKKVKTSVKSLLGIGNPLLDISVDVDDAFVAKYGKKMGDATLAIDSDLPMYKEIVEFKDVLYIAGGSTQNSIRGAQWMSPEAGVTHYIGSIGDDENGKKLDSAARSDGVQTHYYISKTHRTGCCAVLVVDRERSLVADLAAANDYQHSHFLSSEIQELLPKIDIFYSAGFFLTVSPETVVELGKYVSENNKVLAWSVAAPFIAEYYLDKVKAVLPYVDYLVANEKEGEALLKQLGIEDKDEEIALKKLSELPKVNNNRSRVIIFTHGPDPVRIFHEGKLQIFPVPVLSKEVIVDTNGAGDAFFGRIFGGFNVKQIS